MNLPFNISKDQARDAARLAIQSALAAAFCYLTMRLLNLPEKFVGILSAVLVIEPSIGNTYHQAKGRILSTLIGSIIGVLFVVLIPWELGVVISLLLSMLILNGIASLYPEWRYGVVAAVALALGSENNAIETSVDRLIAIAIGVLIGIVISLIIWSEKAENRASRYLRKALKNASDRFEIAINNTRDIDNKDASKYADKFHSNLNYAKKSADTIAFSKKSNILDQINVTEKLYNSILIIHRVAIKSNENISDGSSGIEKDSEKIREQACEIILKFALNKTVKKQIIEEFSDQIEKTKSSIEINSEDKEQSILRNTFMFGLTEIEDCIQTLFDCFYEE